MQHADLLGQRQFRAFMDLLGLPLAAHMSLALEADYLGLTHDAPPELNPGLVRFRPRGASSPRAVAAAQEALAKGALMPGKASKLPGLLGFSATATHGQIGHGGGGGAQAHRPRYCSDSSLFTCARALRQSLRCYEQLRRLPLRRGVRAWGGAARRRRRSRKSRLAPAQKPSGQVPPRVLALGRGRRHPLGRTELALLPQRWEVSGAGGWQIPGSEDARCRPARCHPPNVGHGLETHSPS